jgi:small-conductance mechanosensitive channel
MRKHEMAFLSGVCAMDQIQKMSEYLLPLLVFLITLFSGYILKKFLFARLDCWAQHTKTQIDDIIVEAIEGPFIIWFLMLGLYLALKISRLPDSIVAMTGKALVVLGIISLTLVLTSITSGLLKIYSARIEGVLPVTSLTTNISRIVIFGLGGLVVLNTLGISITPILATLGVGGLAVALALQDTLANFFAGFHVAIAQQVKVGDYVKLDSGEEGYITDINWRTTKIKMLPNNVVLVPNEKLTKSIIVNYYLPDRELAVLVNLGVHYNSDLKKVEKVTCVVAKEIMEKVSGGVPSFEPFIRYNAFGDSSINFTVILRAKEFVDQYLIKHEFIKRLHEVYAKEGIVIPYPMRTITYEQAGEKK